MKELQNVLLTRGIKKKTGWIGLLDVLETNHQPIATLELPWENNKTDISCIPCGGYKCVKHARGWHVQEVVGRTGILIHVGNTTADILGCIVLGMAIGELGGKPAVLSSARALRLLEGLVGDEFILTVR